jgi:hypothetical protein
MALISKLNAIGDAIREKTGGTDKLTLDAMPAEILAIVSGGGGYEPPEAAFNVTGDCSYRFANNGWNWFIDDFGNRITTNDIRGTYIFQGSSLSKIPFDINGAKASSGHHFTGMFKGCNYLTEIPKLNIKPDYMDSIFDCCYVLRELKEESVADIDWSYVDNRTSAYSASRGSTFSYCRSLRKYPNSFLAHGNPIVAYSYSIYYNLFTGCYALDEVVNLPIQHRNATWTSNAFTSTVSNCQRLKRLTFETNEDGSPIKINGWSKQTLDLTAYVGFVSNTNNALGYGFITDTRVIDDATYAALKDNPDWWTNSIDYSRYNHDSAVETINTLPDLSGGKGSNTIKFKGASGAKTDGGAINTLTEEEIAVASAKGWTVTLA